ncbi:MAG TPA: UDP-3-O-(3-hydroxymyristoyl)glucosamine N-acyltransferase, partial [Steroidobacteraceae bacterium]|nr:UDP-3-O-(3-hydroxymyristoyl)glucosamine N-acyltransferase [Steroidobacteraceae bacterium]
MVRQGRSTREFTLGELAVRHGCELRGDPALRVASVAPIGAAGPGSLSFLANPKLLAELRATRATAVVLGAAVADDSPVAALVATNPHATYARMATELYPEASFAPGVHASAIVAVTANIDPSAHIGPHVVIGEGVQIGARTFVGPGCVLEDDVSLAADVRLIARVMVCHAVRIGARSTIHPGAVVGSDGFGYANDQGAWLKVPQVGSVLIGEDVE